MATSSSLPLLPNSRNAAAKRRKVDLACEACRNRKARCDGKKPTCGNCSQRTEQCVYKVTNQQLASTNEYIAKLLNRISELESGMETLQASAASADSTTDTQGRPGGSLYSNLREVSVSGNPERETDPSYSAQSPVDAMGAAAQAVGSTELGDNFYGSSSALSFMRQLYCTISHEGGPDLSTSAKAAVLPQSPSTINNCIVDAENLSLLPRVLSDHLLSLYWTRVHNLYPLVHKATFNGAYEALWQPPSSRNLPNLPGIGLGGSEASGPTSLVFHCALNVMHALGAQFSDLPVPERDKMSGLCLAKSKNLLHLDLFDEGNLSVVQTLLLLTQYFQSTTFPNKCWTTVGTACKMAQGLGLHIEASQSQNHGNALVLETRKRVWHGCIILDMVVSMTMGRPAMLLHSSRISLPEPLEDDDVRYVDPATDEKVTSITFFAEAIKLYRILGRILSHIYKQNDPQSETHDVLEDIGSFDRLVELDTELSQFVEQLPDVLHWDRQEVVAGATANPLLLQQSHVLHVRWLHLRVLLYRPIFAHVCRKGKASPVKHSAIQSDFARSAAFICVEAAINLIEAAHQHCGTEATGAWWYNMFYTRTGAMVILLATACLHLQMDRERLEESWEKCRETLLYKLPQSTTVKNCSENLENLHRRMLRNFQIIRLSERPQQSNMSYIPGQSTPSGLQQETFERGSLSNLSNAANGFHFDESFPLNYSSDSLDFLMTDIFPDSSFNFPRGDYVVPLL